MAGLLGCLNCFSVAIVDRDVPFNGTVTWRWNFREMVLSSEQNIQSGEDSDFEKGGFYSGAYSCAPVV